MSAKVQSCAVIGLEGVLVEVEVEVANGLAAFTIVGLPDAADNESRERVRSAIQNGGYFFPFKQITVNLAPADLREEGPAHDLPIAIGILVASRQINADEQLAEHLFLGELSLNGSVRHVKRALEVAASGGHNILMSGPPGPGKMLLARATPSILPPIGMEEFLEVTKMYSVSGMLPSNKPLILLRPFRSPHHTVSLIELVGGGTIPCPGEMSLAHRGVLFLDELPEFEQNVLESLRQPLEEKVVTLARAQGPITYPANCMLIASMSLCPCGFWGDPVKECICSASAIAHHQKRVNGLLLDHIDIHVEVPRVDDEKLADKRNVETSQTIRSRVQAARERQLQRFSGTKLTCNTEMGPAEVRECCHVEPAAEKLLKAAMQQLHLSARAFHRVLKLARTIADLAGSEMIAATHVAEAVQYRPRVGM
jgi:magnesium chelatase family protein